MPNGAMFEKPTLRPGRSAIKSRVLAFTVKLTEWRVPAYDLPERPFRITQGAFRHGDWNEAAGVIASQVSARRKRGIRYHDI
jgi:hypothetical protein